MTQSVAFDRAAEYYDQTRGFPPGVEKQAAELIAKAGGFDASSHLFEIGIGTGRIGLPVSAHVAGYYGVDLALPMMQRLRQKQTTEPVYIAQADATRLPFPDDTFDGAVSVHVFHLIPAWQGALAEVQRVLRPGAMLFNCWNAEHERDPRINQMWDAWNTVIPEERRQSVGARAEQSPDFIQQQGWQAVGETTFISFAYTFTAARHLDLLRRKVWSRLWQLTDAEVAEGAAAVEAEARKHFNDFDEPVTLGQRFNVQAFRPPA